MKKITTILFLVCICVFYNPKFAFSERVFLKMDGIDGEVTATGYKNWCDVLTWSWQMSSPNLVYSLERAIVRPLIIKKNIDKASPYFFLSLLKGETKLEAILVIAAEFSEIGLKEILRITMSSVRVVNVSTGSSADSHLTESVALAFSKVCYNYFEYDEKGQLRGNIDKCFNVEKNVEE